jgi:7-cyano-7-deazaguanine synthase
MLAIAFGVASTLGAGIVATAVHSGDHAIYPDCRPEFVEAFASMQSRSLEGLHAPALHAPYVGLRKHEIVARGASLQVPFALTWSCYEGGDAHCGRCGTCVERREAFTMAGVVDPTVYAEA